MTGLERGRHTSRGGWRVLCYDIVVGMCAAYC